METLTTPARDPSLVSIFMCSLMMGPVCVVCGLIGILGALAFGGSRGWIMVGGSIGAAILTVPAWTLFLHYYLRGHGRLQTA